MYAACVHFCPFLVTAFTIDEIKHLFGQFQMVYRNMASPSIDFTNPPYFYRPSVTDQISNNGRSPRDSAYPIVTSNLVQGEINLNLRSLAEKEGGDIPSLSLSLNLMQITCTCSNW